MDWLEKVLILLRWLPAIRMRRVAILLACTLLTSATAINAEEQVPQNDSSTQTELQSDEVFYDDQADCYFDTDKQNDSEARIDLIQNRFNTGICQATRWFDQLFGKTYRFNEDEVSGRVSVGLEYNQFEHFSTRSRLHVRAPLKNLNNRFNIFLGKVDEEAYISDTQPSLPGSFHDGIFGEDESWLLGLGYRQSKHKNKGFRYSVGLKLPLDPYVKVRYHYNKPFNEKQYMRFRQTFFWRTERGFGTTSRLNLLQHTKSGDLLRWDTSLTIAEKEIDGMKWYSGATLYHRLHDEHALSIQAFINGETDEEVNVRDYGLRLIWRRPIGREWLYIEVSPSITWPRERLVQEREMSLGFSVLVEMQFGDYRY